ncbi:glycosyltransferase family 1 protein [Deinococcus cavernae]|uniref:Glycosyltransferase family 1 protein n=1 Tax=Deinococcus cavernae TaxID=2320857 RepID=A0A418V9K0_9DEIO|nr:glycosyltransferase family 4 protein [Deinococcus cavernae]RJF72798.1 glycosyltransferase family 1 protein [Deinococcus cavernae]
MEAFISDPQATGREPQPLNILFVTDAPAIGGSEVYMRELIVPMRQHGVSSVVAMPDVPGTAEFRRQLQELGITVHAYKHLSEVAELQQRSAFRLTLLSSWNPRGYRKYYATLRGPFVALIHDQLMLHIPGLPQGIYRAFYEVLAAQDIRGADHIVTVSRWAAQYLERWHGMKNVHAVPNGVDTQKFRPANDAKREELRAKFGFTAFTVLTVARFSIEKNHPTVIEVARRTPELQFVLAGTGYLAAPLKRIATPNVRFLGKRNDVPELYRAADVAFQPTIAENQSLATLEAMSSGTPILTNDIPAQRELVAFGREGLLVDGGAAGSVSGYVKALRTLAAHPARTQEMGRAAREKVLSGHTLEQNAAALAGLLHQLAAR